MARHVAAKRPRSVTTRFDCLLFGHFETVNADEIGGRFSMHERHEAFRLAVKAAYMSNHPSD
jgi:hypothetical protein